VSATGFLRLKKLKGPGMIAAAARHNRRAIQAELGASDSIDPTRSRLNQTLQGPPNPADVALLAGQRLRDAGIGKLRKDAVRALEFVFSLPVGSGLDDQRYFAECAAWVGQSFGGPDNILSVDVHRDEAAPHCHVLLLPLIGGRMVGSDLMGNRQKLLEIQRDFHHAVAARHGLKKAPGRLIGASKRRAASAVLDHLKKASDSALRSAVWPSVRDAIESDPGPYMAALGITLELPKKKLRTMTQIFTSKGRGGSTEKPIGFGGRSKTRTLCPVGFDPAEPLPLARAEFPESRPGDPAETTAAPAKQAGDGIETSRERELDLDPATFDPQTGEFRPPPARPANLKAAAVAWVTAALAATTNRDASNDPAATPTRKGRR